MSGSRRLRREPLGVRGLSMSDLVFSENLAPILPKALFRTLEEEALAAVLLSCLVSFFLGSLINSSLKAPRENPGSWGTAAGGF